MYLPPINKFENWSPLKKLQLELAHKQFIVSLPSFLILTPVSLRISQLAYSWLPNLMTMTVRITSLIPFYEIFTKLSSSAQILTTKREQGVPCDGIEVEVGSGAEQKIKSA